MRRCAPERAHGAVLLAALLSTAFAAPACRRKAPGPAECRAFALELAGRGSSALPPGAHLKSEIDELTRECLVTPYDRELLRCVEESRRFRACHAAFALRHRR
ncbi:MAG TPA: hypothetical protein VGK73_09570 [Polyangiaceae bacterium]